MNRTTQEGPRQDFLGNFDNTLHQFTLLINRYQVFVTMLTFVLERNTILFIIRAHSHLFT